MNTLSKRASLTGPSLNRRAFLKSSILATAATTLSGLATHGADQKSYRVGLIGTGWYGKSDLWRLIQVAPVEVVSLCDPDKQMLAAAAEMASQRQKSRKTPRTYIDYRAMLREKDLDIVLAQAKQIGIELPGVDQINHWYAELQQLGHGRSDTSALLERLRAHSK